MRILGSLLAWMVIGFTTLYFVKQSVPNLPDSAEWAIVFGMLFQNLSGVIEGKLSK